MGVRVASLAINEAFVPSEVTVPSDKVSTSQDELKSGDGFQFQFQPPIWVQKLRICFPQIMISQVPSLLKQNAGRA